MASGALGQALRRTLLRLRGAPTTPDMLLLQRFVDRHDEEAFTELVRRHGPMVLRVCQRVLRHTQDAEDAFQATFIVLARKAAAISQPHLLANWLYGVARRVAREALAMAGKRHAREQTSDDPAHGREIDEGHRSEQSWRMTLDEELERLPDKYRTPLVLCYLQGKTNVEAAQALGCQTGAIEMRLSRARNLLRQRMERRGMALGATALATLRAQEAAAAMGVLPALAGRTSHAAVRAVTGLEMAGLSANAGGLATSVLAALRWGKIKSMTATVAVIAAMVMTLGGATLALKARLASPPPAQMNFATAATPTPDRIVVGQARGGTAPQVTLMQYIVGHGAGLGQQSYNIEFAVLDNVPIKTMAVYFNGKLQGSTASGPNPGTFLVNYGSPDANTFLAGTLVECNLVDQLGRETSVSYTIKSWP
jgi:RNA polymerase sigma factor (sigma-70 family)